MLGSLAPGDVATCRSRPSKARCAVRHNVGGSDTKVLG
jgi:hypothetical protein